MVGDSKWKGGVLLEKQKKILDFFDGEYTRVSLLLFKLISTFLFKVDHFILFYL
jgi:hypothetical protein